MHLEDDNFAVHLMRWLEVAEMNNSGLSAELPESLI
jgi:hypothetical protein